MTERSISAALGLRNPGGKDFERLVGSRWMSKHLGADLLEKVMQPIEFKWVYPGARQTSITVKGYAADLLIDVCNAILSAEVAGDVGKQQANIARQAPSSPASSAPSLAKPSDQ